MAWSRGFFRLWFVASVLWLIVCAGVFSGDIIHPHYSGHAILASTSKNVVFDAYSTEALTLERSKSEGKVRAYLVDGIPKSTIYVESSVPERESLERVARAAPEATRFRDNAILARRLKSGQTLAAVAILPPVLILLMGAALFWAFRGFKPGPAKD